LTLLFLAIIPLLAAPFADPLEAGAKYDLVVYGGTAGGVLTAVAGAREGLNVVLLEAGAHLGGMISGGLSATDYGKKEVIGGYALEFFWRLGNHYQMRSYGQDASWYFEPHVAERVLREMASEAGVTVLCRRRLREKTGVRKEGPEVKEIFMENGSSFEGKIFADCSYEGDLMAQAGVSYTWGRESIDRYGESLAGLRAKTPYHQFKFDISPYDSNGKLLPEISADPAGPVGSEDKKVQAYDFRLCITRDKSNQVPFPKPAGYDPMKYQLLARMLKAAAEQAGRIPTFGELCNPIVGPNKKADVNNNGAFSTDYIGKNWDYPEADYKTRERIWQDHINYVAGFFYFLGHDPQVPKPLQAEVNEWGLAKDEFTDTNNWPHQLYIREARRMIGEYVMIQKDLQSDLTKPDPIGMGSYNSDSHNIQRIVTKDGFVMNEGDMQVAVKPYQIPYRVMLPKRSEVRNLLVPVCFSASHVAYSSLRMEPQYMILGHAAGVAARMAIEGKLAVQDIDSAALTGKLAEQGAVIEYHPSPPRPTWKGFKQLRNQ
jgi:hypothetical protein